MSTFPFPQRRGRSGVVLLEVIIAMTVFAVVSLALVTTLNASFDAARERNRADAVDRGLANQLTLLNTQRLQLGEHDLPADSDGSSYRLSVVPQPMLDQQKQPLPGLYRATITATWNEDGHMETRAVSQLVYQP